MRTVLNQRVSAIYIDIQLNLFLKHYSKINLDLPIQLQLKNWSRGGRKNIDHRKLTHGLAYDMAQVKTHRMCQNNINLMQYRKKWEKIVVCMIKCQLDLIHENMHNLFVISRSILILALIMWNTCHYFVILNIYI